MDIAPTVLSALSIAPPNEIQGRSFVPLFFSDPTDWEASPVVMETMMPWRQYGWSPSSAIVEGDFKYIQAPKPELYDIESDPGELNNLHDQNLDRAEAMAKRLEELRVRYGESSLEGKGNVNMDESTRDRLASLGYLFSGSTSDEPDPDAADVKDMVELMTITKRASDLRASGSEDEAISLLEKVLEASPDSRMIPNLLGTWYAEANELQNAERTFKHLIQRHPDYIEAYHNLGLLYAEALRLEEATDLAQAVLSRLPRSAKGLSLMGIIRLKEQDYQGGLDYLNKAIKYYPTYDKALANRAAAYYLLGEFEKALEDVTSARRIMPDNRRYAQFAIQIEKQLKAKQKR
jgi:tetratricopeptide (TPR) repeat protein